MSLDLAISANKVVETGLQMIDTFGALLPVEFHQVIICRAMKVFTQIGKKPALSSKNIMNHAEVGSRVSKILSMFLGVLP